MKISTKRGPQLPREQSIRMIFALVLVAFLIAFYVWFTATHLTGINQ